VYCADFAVRTVGASMTDPNQPPTYPPPGSQPQQPWGGPQQPAYDQPTQAPFGPPGQPYAPPPAQPYAPPPAQPSAPPPAQPYGAPGQSPYSPPADGFGAPQYQGQYDAQYQQYQPYGAPPAPSTGKRNALIAAVAVVVLAGAGVGAYFAFKGDDKDAGVPSSFAGYTRLTNAKADQVESVMRQIGSSQGGTAKHVLDKADIGVYAKGSAPNPSFVYLSIGSGEVPGSSPNDKARFMLEGALTESQTQNFPPGGEGGVLLCGVGGTSTVEETICGWSDSTTTGLSVSVAPALPPSQVAQITNQLRAVIDN
jgi:hypothetical protein